VNQSIRECNYLSFLNHVSFNYSTCWPRLRGRLYLVFGRFLKYNPDSKYMGLRCTGSEYGTERGNGCAIAGMVSAGARRL
jgi:hypothetical protein